MLTEPSQMVDGLEEVWRSTLEAVEALDDEVFERDTGCPAWTVKDQLSHMIWGQRMLRGEPPEEIVLPESLEHVSTPFAQYMEWSVQERRDRDPAEVVKEFAAGADETVAHFREMSPEQLVATAPGPMGSNIPRSKFLSIQVFDQWVHEQDIRRAIARPGHLEGEVAEHARDRIAVGLGHTLPKAVEHRDAPVVAFEVIGPISRTFALDLSKRPAPPTETPGRPATVSFSIPFDAFVSLGCGRSVPHAQARGRVKVEGDPLLADRLLDHLTVTP